MNCRSNFRWNIRIQFRNFESVKTIVLSKIRRKFGDIVSFQKSLVFVKKWQNVSKFVEIRSDYFCTVLYSDTADLSLGVPQGSVFLGPLLFIVFINDLPGVVHRRKIVLCADDTALFFADRKIQTIQSALQEDLDAVGEWFSLKRLLVNCDKTNVVLFGSKQRLASYKNSPYFYWATYWSCLTL